MSVEGECKSAWINATDVLEAKYHWELVTPLRTRREAGGKQKKNCGLVMTE